MKRSLSLKGEALTAWLLVTPFLALLIVVLFAPFIGIFAKSFSVSDSFGLPFISSNEALSFADLSLANYALVLLEPRNQSIIVATVLISVIVATLLSVVGIFVGYHMVRKSRFPGAISAIVTYPSLAPAITVILAIVWMVSPAGPISYVLFQWLEVIEQPLQLSGSWTAVIIGDMALFATLSVRMSASLFEMVDPALEDASASLGASDRETFFNISLPLVLPGVAAIWILVFIRTMVAYVAALLLGGGSNGVVVLPLEIFNRIQSLGISGTMAQICAYSVVLAAVTIMGRFAYVLLIRKVFKGRLSEEMV